MSRVGRAALVACVLLMPGWAAAATPDVSANWLRKPTGEEVADAYPKVAVHVGVEGDAVIDCDVDQAGGLQNCHAVWETPVGLGFGKAALSLTPSFRMSAALKAGKPVASTVRIPIGFRLPKAEVAPEPPKAASAHALEIARRIPLVQFMNFDQCQKNANEIEFIEGGDASDAAVKAAAAAMRQACQESEPALRDAVANLAASVFSESELQALAAADASRAGKVLQPNEDLMAIETVIARSVPDRIRSLGRTAFCKAQACGSEPAEAAPPRVDIAKPTWAEQPSPEDLAEADPMLAAMLGLGGWAHMTCKVAPGGLLDACAVAAESPAGVGFGVAALSVAHLYRLQLAAKGAAPGKTVAVEVSFPDIPATPPPATPQGHSERAVALAKTYLGADALNAQLPQVVDNGIANLLAAPMPGVGATTRQAAVAALRQAAAQTAQEAMDQMARALATFYSADELAAAIAFQKSPGGQALSAKQPQLQQAGAAVATYFSNRVQARAHELFCSKFDCTRQTPKLPPERGQPQAAKPEPSTPKP